MPTLMVHLPGLPPVQHVLRDETTTIGRMKGNSILIEDSSISLVHARITRKNGDYFLKDLNSTNGTFVNAQPVAEAKLQDGDRIRFADVTTQFMGDGAGEVARSAMTSSVSAAVPVPPPPQFATASAPAIPPQPLPPANAPPPPVHAPGQSALPTRSAAPQFATTAAPDSPARSNSRSATPQRLNRSRIISWICASAGAVAAVCVLAIVGWRFTHLPNDKNETASSAVPASLAESAKSAPASLARISEPSAAQPATVAAAATAPEPKLSDNPLELGIFLKSGDVNLRRRAGKALHGLGGEAAQAAGTLREALTDSDEEVQMWAALALVNCQQYDKRAVPILIKALQNDNSVLRQVACLSLGLVPYEEGEKDIVVPALAEIAGRDTDEDVRKAAKSALNIIAPDLYAKPFTSKP